MMKEPPPGRTECWSSGTEVVLELRVFDVRTAKPMADIRAHWQNGGSFVIKGVGSLDQDMSAALAAVLK